MDQITFSDVEFANKKRKTRRELVLERMEGLIPWKRLEKKIRKHYPKPGRGRPPYPLSVMLRVHCVQLFYDLSDPAMEDMLYEVDSVRRFTGLTITGAIPDESTILKFRHLLEKHDLGAAMFNEINKHLADQGLALKQGTIVDASIISAPSSTKNKTRERDPEMHQTKKGNQWYFGMKLHIGADAETGVVHSFSTTAANVSDIIEVPRLLHGQEQEVWADAGYQGVHKRPENEGRTTQWDVAMKPGVRKELAGDSPEEAVEHGKASVRAKVEHPFFYVKRMFGYGKVRYRGLAKNTQRFAVLLGFTNLLISERYAHA